MGNTHAHTVSNEPSHKLKYFIIFLIVTILIVFDVFVVKSGLPYSTKAGVIIASCVAKVFIELFFYMHLKDETKWMMLIASVPVLSVILAIVLVLEGAYR